MLSLRDIHLQKGSFTLKKVSFDVEETGYFVIREKLPAVKRCRSNPMHGRWREAAFSLTSSPAINSACFLEGFIENR